MHAFINVFVLDVKTNYDSVKQLLNINTTHDTFYPKSIVGEAATDNQLTVNRFFNSKYNKLDSEVIGLIKLVAILL